MKHIYRILVLWVSSFSFQVNAQSLYPVFSWTKPSDTVAYQKALSYFEQQNYNSCIKTLRRLPKAAYEQAATYRLLGVCLTGKAAYPEAVDALTQGIRFDSTSVGLFYDRAYAYMQWDKFSEAVADLKRVAQYLPGNHHLTLNIAYCLYASGQLDEAIAELEAVADPDTAVANSLGWYYLENGDYGKAIFLLEPLLQEHPSFAPAYETLSLAFSAMGYTPEAIQAADILIQLQPDYGRAYFLKGAYLEEADRDEEAEACFRIAKKLGYEWDDF